MRRMRKEEKRHGLESIYTSGLASLFTDIHVDSKMAFDTFRREVRKKHSIKWIRKMSLIHNSHALLSHEVRERMIKYSSEINI
jgi:hypothetical protein